MAVKTSWNSGDILTAADLTDTFAAKLDVAGGKILQVVRNTNGSDHSTTSTSFVDATDVNVTITPAKSTSGIVVLCFFAQAVVVSGDLVVADYLLTDSSNSALMGSYARFGVNNMSGTSQREFFTNTVLSGYASATNTSARTYKMRFRGPFGATARIDGSVRTTEIYAIEVSA